jgi:hypothetical protein
MPPYGHALATDHSHLDTRYLCYVLLTRYTSDPVFIPTLPQPIPNNCNAKACLQSLALANQGIPSGLRRATRCFV